MLIHRTSPGLWQPLSGRFHAHSGDVDVAWADVRTAPDEAGRPTHPRAYAAKGSHASYRRGGVLQVLSTGSHKILAVKDDARACPQCPLWFTGERLINAEKQPWYGLAVRGEGRQCARFHRPAWSLDPQDRARQTAVSRDRAAANP